MFGYKYHLLSPHYVSNESTEFFNLVYASWKKCFTKVLVDDAGGTLDPDDFFRCDQIGVITYENQIVGHCLMTVFDLRLQSSLEHHYIKDLSPKTLKELRDKNLNRLVTIEYLNVVPEWRKHHQQVPWAEVLIAMGLQLMDHSYVDALLGMPRIDVKVNEICHFLDAYEIQEPIKKMKYPCAVLIFEKNQNRNFKREVTQQFAKGLWNALADSDKNVFAEKDLNKKTRKIA